MATRNLVGCALLGLAIGCGSSESSAPDGGSAADAGPDATAQPDGGGLGEEHGTDAPVVGPASDSQVRVAAARGQGGYLFVWEDERRDEGGDIFGARVSLAGEVLDPVGLPICTAGGTQEAPRVASDGEIYLVVWTDWRLLGLTVYAARVTGAGEVLDPDGIQIAFGAQPDVAFDGADFVVVWQSDSDIVASRVSPDGEVLDPGGVEVCGAGGEQSLPSVAAASSGVLVAWVDRRDGDDTPDLYAGRLSESAEPLDGSGVLVARDVGGAVRLAFDGTQYWATWEGKAADSAAGLDVFVARIALDATVIDAEPIAIAGGPGTQGGPSVAYDGTYALIAWHDQVDPEDSYAFDIRMVRLGADGTPADPEPIAVSAEPGQQARPFVLSAGGDAWVAWDGDSTEPWDIYASRVEGGVVASPGGQRITASANAQLRPRMSAYAGEQLLVWSDRRDAPFARAYAQHIESSGLPRDEPVQPLSAEQSYAFQPSVAGGDPSLVCFAAWLADSETYGIVATRVGATGGAMDPAGIAVVDRPETHFEPAVASDGDTYLVVWEAQVPEREYSAIYAARVSAGGEVLDPGGFLVSSGDAPATSPSVAFGDGVFLVAWYRLDPPWYDVGATIEVAVVTADGQVTAQRQLGSPDPQRDKVEPEVAFDGERFLVVWELHLYTGWNIYATRVTPAGEPLDAEGIAITDTVAEDGVLYIAPAVVFDGEHYVIGWEDEYLTGIRTARLGADGTLVDQEPIEVAAEPLGQRHVDLSVTGSGEVTATYERFDPTAGAWRVFQRRLAW